MPGPGEKKLEVGIVLDDKLTGHLDRIRKNIGQLERAASVAGTGMSSAFAAVLNPIRGVLSSVFSLRTAFVGIGAAWAATRFADAAVQVENLETAFGNLVKRIGSDSVTVLNHLRGALKGTASDMELMEAANKAIMLGAARSVEDLDLLATVARRLGRAMGQDAAKSLDDIVIGMGRMSPKILDNLGIVLKMEAATEAYAAAQGKLVSELSEAEKREAFMTEFYRQARSIMTSMGEDVDTTADKWGKLKATLKNFWEDLQRAALPIIGDLSVKFTKWFNENRQAIFNWGAGILEAAQVAIPALIDALRALGTQLSVLWTPFSKIAELAAKVKLGAAQYESYQAKGRLIASLGELGPIGAKMTYSEDRSTLAKLFGAYPQKPEGEILGEVEDYVRLHPEALTGRFGENYKAYQTAETAHMDAAHLLAYLEGNKNVPGYEAFVGPEAPLGFLGQAAAQLRLAGAKTRPEERGGAGGTGTAAVKETNKVLTETDRLLSGISETLYKINQEWTDFSIQAKKAILDVAEALSDNLANGFYAIITGAKSFGAAVKEMAKGVLDDLAKILSKMVAVRLIGMAIGMIPGIGGAAAGGSPAGSAFDVGDLGQTSNLPGGQYGGIFSSPHVIAERPGLVEAAVPLPGNRRIPVEVLNGGLSQGGQTTIFYVQTIDAKSFDTYFKESAGRQPSVIGTIAMRQYQDNRVVRGGMRR
jgi:hypothetical protein